MPWKRSVTSQKPVPHFISNRLTDSKAEKYGPKLIMLANSFHAYQRSKRISSSPSGRVPSSLIKFSPEERTVCVMHQITDSSRTHGTRPDSEDSTPSAELSVRLLTSASSILFSFFLYRPLFFITYILKNCTDALIALAALCVLIIPGGFVHGS